jgi:hypothetical protein
MKDIKVMLPILYVTSWFGTFMLTLFAAVLVFGQSEPLTPVLFLTAAACVLSGNLLPLIVFGIHTRWQMAEQVAEAAAAEVSVRHALARSEEVVDRLALAEGALSKGVLVARQLPEKLEAYSASVSKSEEQTEEMNLIAARIEATGQRVETVWADFRAGLEALPKLEDLEAEKTDPSLNERIDLLSESLEGIEESLDHLLGLYAELKMTGRKKKAPAKKAVMEPKAAEIEEAPRPAAQPDPQEELSMDLPVPDETPPSEVPGDLDAPVIITVHALIGINNRLMIRGDGPQLSWDEGAELKLTGIGEYQYRLEPFAATLEVAFLVNDSIWAAEGNVKIEPGTSPHVHVSFPKD